LLYVLREVAKAKNGQKLPERAVEILRSRIVPAEDLEAQERQVLLDQETELRREAAEG
jgi:hypothetical protein